ncbi:Tyrosine-tRNA ligase, cytoplasmic [Daldinia childiae]|uniref:Tyrosine-tRNA ligase, cytoplasmic n=1 Tax=Daldinia childiae TaxID=326645 RepID=UPI0014483B7F|nr:Tyrosine-tRNA ligase, cytoplasmic [Daldinia childiae]KAF3057144.1 Tyrosine-tRNA ligase, cytoplasmic [Daldinia childiae]
MIKFAEFIKAGVEVVVLLHELFSYLDNVKYSAEHVTHRMACYRYTVIAALEAIGVPLHKIHIVEEGTYHTTPEFVRDLWRLCKIVPQQAVKDAWNPGYEPDMLSPMLCPGLQALAEEYCNVDIQFGGTDQRGLFKFAELFMPLIGFADRARLMNPMLPSLRGGKMSSSHPPETKIMFQDPAPVVKEKIEKAYASAATTDQNGVFALVKDMLLPIRLLQAEGILEVQGAPGERRSKGLVLPRTNGRIPKEYLSIDEIKHDLEVKELASEVFTTAVADAVNILLDHVRQAYAMNEEWQKADKYGYPESA